MPFNKFLNQSPEDFGAALRVSGFSIRNEFADHPNKEPFPFDYNLPLFNQGDAPKFGSTVASGEFYTSDPVLHWHLINPATKSIIPENEIVELQSFYGYNLSIKDETGKLIKSIATGYKKNDFKVDIKDLINDFQSSSGEDPRRFRFEVSTNDYYNRSHTGTYFLNSPKPNVTGLSVNIGANSLGFDPELEKVSGIRSIGYYAAIYSGYTINPTGSGSLTHQFSHEKNLVGNPNATFGLNIQVPSESGLYYTVVASDQYGTGDAYVFPSSVKTFSIDPLKFNVKPTGLEGKVTIERDNLNRVINTKAVAKFNRDFIGLADYEVKVLQSGDLLEQSDSFYIQPPFIDGVNKIVHGTGAERIDFHYLGQDFSTQDFYYSGLNAEPVFATYNTTGIQWKEHTLLIDSSKNLPPQFLTGQSLISEVAVPAGNTLSQKIYFGFAFDQNTEDWVFYPSGGYYNSGIYTGTYADAATGGVLTYISNDPSGPNATGPQGDIISSGYFAIETGATGSLVATNLSGFLLTEYEPRFSYDIQPDCSYKFSVRPKDEDGNFGDASDNLSITTGDIISAITGAGYQTGLFNGDTNSGLAFYNADLDVLNISDNLFSSGSGLGINVSTPEHHFHVSGDAQISGYLYDSQNTTGEAGYILSSEEGGPQWKQIEDVLSGVGGSGISNYVARWADEDTLTTGALYDNGTNVGVGTASPSSKLHVDGDIKIDAVIEDTDPDKFLVWDSATKLVKYSSSSAGAQGATGAQGAQGDTGN
ncbi:hypothetical protein OAL45_01000, partial [bacterium]|nr:hypothetical protein [bacterium]